MDKLSRGIFWGLKKVDFCPLSLVATPHKIYHSSSIYFLFFLFRKSNHFNKLVDRHEVEMMLSMMMLVTLFLMTVLLLPPGVLTFTLLSIPRTLPRSCDRGRGGTASYSSPPGPGSPSGPLPGRVGVVPPQAGDPAPDGLGQGCRPELGAPHRPHPELASALRGGLSACGACLASCGRLVPVQDGGGAGVRRAPGGGHLTERGERQGRPGRGGGQG
jgi:hypothetical protein